MEKNIPKSVSIENFERLTARVRVRVRFRNQVVILFPLKKKKKRKAKGCRHFEVQISYTGYHICNLTTCIFHSVSHYEDGRRGSNEGSTDRDSLRSCTYCCRPTSRIWAQPPSVMVTSLQRPEPVCPVWPGMQSKYQTMSVRVHPQPTGPFLQNR